MWKLLITAELEWYINQVKINTDNVNVRHQIIPINTSNVSLEYKEYCIPWIAIKEVLEGEGYVVAIEC